MPEGHKEYLRIMAHELEVVYTYKRSNPKVYGPLFLFVVFVVGIALFSFLWNPENVEEAGARIPGLLLAGAFILAGGLGFIFILRRNIAQSKKLNKLLENKEFEYTEGYVTNYEAVRPNPNYDTVVEYFDVGEVSFILDRSEVDASGYSQKVTPDRYIREQRYVRIGFCTIDGRNVILHLEVEHNL